MNGLFKLEHWLGGFQWLFFLFTNTVVIPITVGAAFQLPHEKLISLIQFSFIFTGLACVLQALFGHKRSIMEGQSGLWWGVILSVSYAAPSQGLSLLEVGGSLSVGIIISGVITVVIGLSGFSQVISKWFTNGVMAVFMLLLAVRLNTIFLKGMLGIPFGAQSQTPMIDLPVFLLSSVVAAFVIIFSIKVPPSIGKYSLLIGIIGGWLLYSLLFDQKDPLHVTGNINVELFPLGPPSLDAGLIILAVIAGILNTSNTFGALKGTEEIYQTKTSMKQYRQSFTISGLFVMISGLFGMVPYAPYVSSIGFLNQTKILDRLPFIIGGAIFMFMGIIPAIGNMMAKLPLSIGSAVLFVTYLRLLQSSLQYFVQIQLTPANLYRLAVPLFVGICFMSFPSSYFESIPGLIRPLVSNGLLVGILLSLIIENSTGKSSSDKNKQNKQDVFVKEEKIRKV